MNGDFIYPLERFQTVWRQFLLNQFHDCLPGSSIPEVYDDLYDSWMEFKEILDGVLNDWTGKLAVPKGTQLTLSNPVGWNRKSPVFIAQKLVEGTKLDAEGKPPYIKLTCVTDEKDIIIGQPVASEGSNIDDTRPAGWWAIVELNAYATKCYKVEVLKDAATAGSSVFKTNAGIIESPTATVEISQKTGAITKWTATNINNNKNLLRGDQSNLSVGFVDDQTNDHAWNLKYVYWEHQLSIPNDNDVKVTVIDNGPVFATLQIEKSLGSGPVKEKLVAKDTIGENKVIQKVTLFKDDPTLY